ncbi:MAG: sigma 54-interacting transcriptional regulator [Proteobacteria bacterium]|nr:sigma 54-interacting transcriptional regulator [Pseudomonadota bacterium]
MTEKSGCVKMEHEESQGSNEKFKRTPAESLLRERGLQLKGIVEAFDGLIYLSSQDFLIEFMNEQYINRLGYDATGQLCYKALHHRDSVCPWCLNPRVFKGETVRCEVSTPRENWYYVVSTPIYHSDGTTSKLAMIMDISDRKQAERSLEKKVEEQKLLLDNIQTQIWYLTDEKTYGAVNQAHADFLKLDKKDVEQKTLYDTFGKKEAEAFIAHNRKVFDQKIKVCIEKWVVNSSGDKRLLSINITPKLDGNGNVEYVVCSGEDITEYRKSEELLRQSKKRLDLAMEATSDALWDLELDTNKAFFNPCFYTMLGYQPYELPQSFKTWETLIHPEDKEATIKMINEYVQKKIGSFEVEYRLKTKHGGWRWIMARGKVVERNESGTPVRMVGTHVDITERKLNEDALRISEAHLREENKRLRESFKGSNQFGNIIGKSKKMHEVYETILKAAVSNANVIIYGESGTGKEIVAQTIHELSNRGGKNFVTVNCGAIPDNLIESEFFGYKKGAFTGADSDKPGYLDIADGGTLFMDEVGELDLNLQVKLLRAIEGGGYTPIGSRDIKKSDMRIIAATNKDLKECVEKGLVREDFYYRIHVIPIQLPPLRERKEDIPLLVYHFLQAYGGDEKILSIPENIIKSMQDYDWPGNVRELQNAIHRYITLKEIDFLDISQIKPVEPSSIYENILMNNNRNLKLRAVMESFEKKYIEKLLHENQWHKSKVASILGIDRRTLFRKMKDYGVN